MKFHPIAASSLFFLASVRAQSSTANFTFTESEPVSSATTTGSSIMPLSLTASEITPSGNTTTEYVSGSTSCITTVTMTTYCTRNKCTTTSVTLTIPITTLGPPLPSTTVSYNGTNHTGLSIPVSAPSTNIPVVTRTRTHCSMNVCSIVTVTETPGGTAVPQVPASHSLNPAPAAGSPGAPASQPANPPPGAGSSSAAVAVSQSANANPHPGSGSQSANPPPANSAGAPASQPVNPPPASQPANPPPASQPANPPPASQPVNPPGESTIVTIQTTTPMGPPPLSIPHTGPGVSSPGTGGSCWCPCACNGGGGGVPTSSVAKQSAVVGASAPIGQTNDVESSKTKALTMGALAVALIAGTFVLI